MKKYFFLLYMLISFTFFVSAEDKNWNKKVYIVEGYTEEEARALHDSRSTDPIEGIWQNYRGERWSIERFTDENIPSSYKYRMVRVKPFKFLKKGVVDGFLELTADKGTFNLDICYKLTKSYIPHVATLLYRDRLDISGAYWNTYLMKIYPTVESKSSEEPSTSIGSGFALSSDGYIATCDHVASSGKYIQVTGINGDFTRSYDAKTILSDPITDLAVLKIVDPEFVTLGAVNYGLRTSLPVEGETCYAIGYPHSDILGNNVKVTNGIVSAVNAGKAGPVFCQISVPVTYGNSGGPLIDSDGNILGIVSGGYGDKAAYLANLAVKASYLKLLLDSDPNLRNLTLRPTLRNLSQTEIINQIKRNVYLLKVSNNKPESTDKHISVDRSKQSVSVSENRTAMLNDAKEKHRAGEYEAAVSVLSAELQEDTTWADAYYIRALCYSALNRQKDAISDYSAVLKYHKENDTDYSLLEIYQNKSICQAFIGLYDDAYETIGKAVSIDPSNAKTLEIRGYIYYYLKNYRKCIDDLTRAIAEGNSTATIFYFRGLAKFATDDLSGAVSDMEQAASMGDRDAESWLNAHK